MPKLLKDTVKICVAVMVVLLLLIGLFLNSNTTYEAPHDGRDFSAGWYAVAADGKETEVSFPLNMNGGVVCLTNTLPQLQDETVLLVKCNYKSLTAEVDGEQIYSSHVASVGWIETDVGHYVALIPLDSSHSNRQIRLVIEERESGYNAGLNHIQLTTMSQYGFGMFLEKWVYLLVAAALLWIAAAMFVLWLFFGKRIRSVAGGSHHVLIWVSIFALSLGVWIITEPHFWGIATGKFASSGLMNYAALMMLPTSLLGLERSLYPRDNLFLDLAKLYFEIIMVFWSVCFLLGLADLSGLLRSIHIHVGLSVVVFILFMVVRRKDFALGKVLKVGFGISACLCIAAIVQYAVGGDYMVFAVCAVVVIIISALVYGVSDLLRAFNEANKNLQYKEFALKDVMTGLGSRLAYSAFCDRYAHEAPKDMIVVYMDTNGLKYTNDNYGHDAGDELIIATAQCIRETFGWNGEYFRLGGDEFLVALRGDVQQVADWLEIFEQKVKNWHGQFAVELQVPYGMAAASEYPDKGINELIAQADRNMYLHKHRASAPVCARAAQPDKPE